MKQTFKFIFHDFLVDTSCLRAANGRKSWKYVRTILKSIDRHSLNINFLYDASCITNKFYNISLFPLQEKDISG